jgi:polysaccharide biosynthesis protein PslH
MKILMLTPYLPYPPSSGGQIRSYNLIKQLSKKHEITLYSLIKFDEERQYVSELKKYCKEVKVFNRPTKPWKLSNIFRTGTSKFPFLVIRNYSNQEKKDIADLLKKDPFDIIHAETFYVSPHIPPTDIPIVLVDQTIEYQVYQHFVQSFRIPFLRPLLSLDVMKIKYWESYYWKKAARVVAVSVSDASKMKKIVPSLKVDVVPNGVGEDLLMDVPIHRNNQILFMGNFAWLQNIEAAKILALEVFPKVLEKVPNATLLIAGQNTSKIAHLQNEHIKLVDLKIEDIEGVKQAYKESGLLCAPLYGPGGTRLKILGAMAAKLPVVTTDVGIEGIDAVHGESVLYGKKPEDLAKLTIDLLTDDALYKKIVKNAHDLVYGRYTYEQSAAKLDAIYQEVTHG